MPFQTTVNVQPAPGQPGDFAAANPRNSSLAGPGALVAGPGGITVGRFGWVDATVTYVSNAQIGTTPPNGFLHRGSHQQLITAYLAETGGVLPQGFEVTLHSEGDFWAATKTATTYGQKVFASTTDGTVSTGAAGALITGSIETKWYCYSVQAIGEVIKISTTAPF